jgi:hypothetical protein
VSDRQPPIGVGDAVVVAGVVVSAGVVVVSPPPLPAAQFNDSCQLCMPLSLGMTKQPVALVTGAMAQPQPVVPNVPGMPDPASTAGRLAAMAVQLAASLLQQTPPVDKRNPYALCVAPICDICVCVCVCVCGMAYLLASWRVLRVHEELEAGGGGGGRSG